MDNKALISIIVPIYNEAENIPRFFVDLTVVLDDLGERYNWEIIFVNDGSVDDSSTELQKFTDSRVRVLEFSRNFGKEAALSAGLQTAKGDAALMIDADFQHPLSLIPEFVKKWENGAEVTVGIRKRSKANLLKRFGSFLFYKIIRRIANVDIVPNETDFRILDREVIDAFNALTERNRMTRGLIDWLGFKREYIDFEANVRVDGHAGYGLLKLFRLAINGFVSLSLLPLKLAGYLGALIVFTVGPFGLYVLLGRYLFNWAYPASFSGPAQLALLITFLVGIVLCSLGLVALYVANIHDEILARPLYVVRKKRS